MTVNLATLYSRLGKLMGIAKTQIDARAAITSRVTTLDGSYDAASRYMFTPVLNYFENLGKTQDKSITQAVSGAVKTLTEMVTADNPSIPKNVNAAMAELNRQMIASSSSFPLNAISFGIVSYNGTNVGTGKVVLNSYPVQMSPTETLRFECVSDVSTGTAAGSEAFKVVGSANVSDITSDLYPAGSGANTTLVSTNYDDGQTVLQNGTFENWTASVPDGWTINAGAAYVTQLSSGAFRGSSALQLDGTAATNISQILPTSICYPNRRVTFGMWVKLTQGSPTLALKLELRETAGGTLLATATLAGSLTSSYQLVTASYIFSAYAPYPEIAAYISYPLQAGVKVAVDCAFVTTPAQQGKNGQFITILGGDVNWRIGDYATVAITNNYAATVLNYTERFFAPCANGIELPGSSSPTIANSVIP
jgi:hypothetical protein